MERRSQRPSLHRTRSVEISLPSLSEQELVIGRAEEILSVKEKLKQVPNDELQKPESLRQSIQKNHLFGQLTPDIFLPDQNKG